LIKRRKFNFSSSFTLLELLVVIIVIGIIAGSLSFDFSPDRLHLIASQLLKDIRYTQSLALKNDKYQPFPVDNTAIEQNRSKYWFKQWWQIKFSKEGDDIIYYVFSDHPSSKSANFNRQIIDTSLKLETAKNPEGFYLYGGHTYLTTGVNTNQDLNLSKYHIKRIELKTGSYRYSNGYIHLLFDNCGNVFLNEGKYVKNTLGGDQGDINPLDPVRKLVTSEIRINLCKKLNSSNNCDISEENCLGLSISPAGYAVITKCIKIY
jgi:prepilin-type N-terminal cleavage/methylation domain-containing protein